MKIRKRIVLLMISCLAMICFLTGCSDSQSTVAKQIAWSFDTKASVQSSPIIYQNMLLFGSNSKKFYAVDLDTQKEVWSIALEGGMNSKAVIQDDTVYFSAGEICYAVDGKTGKLKWQYDPEVKDKARKDWDFHDASLVLYKDMLLFATADGRIIALNQQNGAVNWQFNTGKNQLIRTTPVIEGSVMFFGDWGGNFYAVDLNDHSLKWTVNTDNKPIQTAPFVHKNLVYFGGRDTVIHAFDIQDGKEIWSQNDPQQSWLTGEIFIDKDLLYVAGSDNHQVWAMNPETGEIVQKYGTEKNIFSKQIIVDDIMYVTDGDAYNFPGAGNLYAFDLKNGKKPLWKVSFKGNVFSTPLIDKNNAYIGSADGKMYGISLKNE